MKDIPFSIRCSPIKASENNWRKSISSSPVSGTIGPHASCSPAGNKGNPLTAWRPISLCHRSLKCNSLRGNQNLSWLHSGSNVLQQARRRRSITLTDNSGYLVFLLAPHFSVGFAKKIQKPLNRKKTSTRFFFCLTLLSIKTASGWKRFSRAAFIYHQKNMHLPGMWHWTAKLSKLAQVIILQKRAHRWLLHSVQRNILVMKILPSKVKHYRLNMMLNANSLITHLRWYPVQRRINLHRVPVLSDSCLLTATSSSVFYDFSNSTQTKRPPQLSCQIKMCRCIYE